MSKKWPWESKMLGKSCVPKGQAPRNSSYSFSPAYSLKLAPIWGSTHVFDSHVHLCKPQFNHL